MPSRDFGSSAPQLIRADQVQPGMWIVDPQNPRFDRRVVDVGLGPLEEIQQIRIRHDYGNGGEPATSFYGAADRMYTLPHVPH